MDHPTHANLGPVGAKVLQELQKHSALAEKIFFQQCERLGMDPERLTAGEQEPLVAAIADALARFASAEKAAGFRRAFPASAKEGPGKQRPSFAVYDLFAPQAQVEPFSMKVYSLIRRFTPFAWQVMETICSPAGLDPARLQPRDLTGVASQISEAVGRFTTDQKHRALEAELRALASGG